MEKDDADYLLDVMGLLSPEGADNPDQMLIETLQIDDALMDEAFRALPGQLAYWNARYAAALEKCAFAEAELEREEARSFLMARGAKNAKGQPLSVDDAKARMRVDPELDDARTGVIVAQATKAKMRGIVDAVSAKRDMLQSLGAKLRVEMMGDPVLREQMAGMRSQTTKR